MRRNPTARPTLLTPAPTAALAPAAAHMLAIALALLALLSSCARAPLKSPTDRENALRPTSAPSELARDDLPLADLARATRTEIDYLKANASAGGPWVFGPRTVSREEYIAGLERFAALAEQTAQDTAPDRGEKFARAISDAFDFFEVYGQQNWGDVFISSYYEPMIEGSRRPTQEHPQPLYRAPEDLVSLDLTDFDPKFKDERKLRGRVVKNAQGTLSFQPYYSREDIDSRKVLARKKLELVYVDPWDAFLLQIQGSGTVHLKDGTRIRLIVADKNGAHYDSIGKFIKDKIAPEDVNLDTIEAYLRKQSPEEQQKLMNLNASYIFFIESDEPAITKLGVPATDGRTIATDSRLFPKGALAFLTTAAPSPTGAPLSRFVLDQDIGGAISGPGRLDLFWGRGDEAKRAAGRIKLRGRLVYLAPKPAPK